MAWKESGSTTVNLGPSRKSTGWIVVHKRGKYNPGIAGKFDLVSYDTKAMTAKVKVALYFSNSTSAGAASLGTGSWDRSAWYIEKPTARGKYTVVKPTVRAKGENANPPSSGWTTYKSSKASSHWTETFTVKINSAGELTGVANIWRRPGAVSGINEEFMNLNFGTSGTKFPVKVAPTSVSLAVTPNPSTVPGGLFTLKTTLNKGVTTPVTYTYKVRVKGTSTWSTIKSTSAASITWTATKSVYKYEQYLEFQVTAKNSAGSKTSSTVTRQLLWIAPGICRNLNIVGVAYEGATVSLQWDTPLDIGSGIMFYDYKVYINEAVVEEGQTSTGTELQKLFTIPSRYYEGSKISFSVRAAFRDTAGGEVVTLYGPWAMSTIVDMEEAPYIWVNESTPLTNLDAFWDKAKVHTWNQEDGWVDITRDRVEVISL